MVLIQPIIPTVRDASLPVLLVALVVYLAPSVVAFTTNCQQSRAVLAINLFLGWSLVGWAVSLAMALDLLGWITLPPKRNAGLRCARHRRSR